MKLKIKATNYNYVFHKIKLVKISCNSWLKILVKAFNFPYMPQ